MASEHRLRCGDTARINGTDYDIEVAYADYSTGSASWFGWPEGTAELEKVALVQACSDDEHRRAVAQWLDRSGTADDHRRSCIERLYRPLAFARKQHELARQRLADARSTFESAELALREAKAGSAEESDHARG